VAISDATTDEGFLFKRLQSISQSIDTFTLLAVPPAFFVNLDHLKGITLQPPLSNG
jgi:hypothetical protein